jgi:hypothetical protein
MGLHHSILSEGTQNVGENKHSEVILPHQKKVKIGGLDVGKLQF